MLVEQYHTSMVRVARIYVRDAAIAEEVAQETWLAVLNGLDLFEGRFSVKTWIFTFTKRSLSAIFSTAGALRACENQLSSNLRWNGGHRSPERQSALSVCLPDVC